MSRALVFLFLVSAPAIGITQVPARLQGATEEALARLVREDSFVSIAFIEAMPSPVDAMAVFTLLTRHLYWENRNLEGALVIGRAGIQFGLAQARDDKNSEVAAELKSQAKALAYDVSSFCWPGWNEPGVIIGDSELVLAQDLAKTNLRLARELAKGDLPMSRAWWLLGAHHLAVEQHEAARRAFLEAIRFAIAAEAKEQELMLRGYIYLADMLDDINNDKLNEEFEFVLAQLARTREGSFHADQLLTARWVFLGIPEN